MDISREEAWQAKQEGWKVISGGYVRRIFDSRGGSPFADEAGVIRHLRFRGKTSEFHRRMYMAIPWTNNDETMAHDEGWRADLSDFHPWYGSAHTLSESEINDTIRQRAEEGDPLYIKAIVLMAKRKLLGG